MPRNLTLLIASLVLLPLASAGAATPTVDQALTLKPVQEGVDYDTPEGDDIAACTLKGHEQGKETGWIVFSKTQQHLRRFLDTNGDGKVDQWCYYKNGIEVYRDIDSNFNGKADQYRWLGTAGIRWGLDQDEDHLLVRRAAGCGGNRRCPRTRMVAARRWGELARCPWAGYAVQCVAS